MDTPRAIARLADHQDAILAQVADTRRLLRHQGRDALPELAKHRWVTMRLLRSYQLFKHVEIFDPAIAGTDAPRARLAAAMKQRCVVAGEDYQAHVAAWSGAAIEQRWDDYAAAVIAMLDRVGRHIAHERRDVDLLLAGTQRTRLPARPRVSGSAAA